MKNEERLKNYPLHKSQRGWFGYQLYRIMAKMPDVWLVCADLGYKLFDPHFEDFPDRVINTGASEQAAMGIAIGLALKGKIPFIYSHATFILRRPYETIQLYVNQEQIPVKIVGAGRTGDYAEDGPSHNMPEAKDLLATMPNIAQFWPETDDDVTESLGQILTNNKPCFLSLKRH